jgi:hypothetical protein
MNSPAPTASPPKDSTVAGLAKTRDTVIIHDTVRIAPKWKPLAQNRPAAIASPANTAAPTQINQPSAPSGILSKQIAPPSPSPPPVQVPTTSKSIYDSVQ